MHKKLYASALVVTSVAAVSFIFTPSTLALSAQETGDQALLNKARPLLTGNYNNVSIGLVNNNTGTIKLANFGANSSTEYEVGSISKTFVGNLYGVALEKGEVTNTQKIGAILPIGTGPFLPTGNRTLDELTSHRAGLPSFASTPGMQLQLGMSQSGRSLYTTDADLVSQAQATFYLPSVGK